MGQSSGDLLEPVHVAVLARYTERSQRLRRSGALGALAVALTVTSVIGVLDPAREANGIDLVRAVTIGLAGSLLGAIAAEAFRLRRPAGPRTASLQARVVADYADLAAGRREAAVVAVAIAGVAVALATGAGAAPLAWAAAVFVVAGTRRWAVARIVERPRPALAAATGRADDRIRVLAAREGVSRPAAILAALLAGAEAGALQQPIGDAAASLLLLAAAIWWWRGRSLGLTDAELAAVGTRSHLGAWVLTVVVVVGALATVVALSRA